MYYKKKKMAVQWNSTSDIYKHKKAYDSDTRNVLCNSFTEFNITKNYLG